ncbi:Asp23/Gls24 family envelope stress response protein [Corynebacterium pseudopelargi]|uniref:Asp23/Gls24 family envelope stress response protein n=1 Tax=Corynebacterium pseudopelargi TaxID=2080757 RepID=A0A3G6IWW0_9CORY|nr:Asp23/Gls24 family envelope stress response protein [Corynebacterium pseudopelargi]AZA10053.1 hypothetical protein CPPEL_09750 [Corynebacterium pseudopelargi]
MPSSTLTIDERALTTIAKAAVLSVRGTSAVSKVAGRDLPRVDVRLDAERKTANVEAFIAATWPSPVTDLTGVVREAIREWLETYAGVEALRVNVVVSELVRGQRLSTLQAPTPPSLFHPKAIEREAIEPRVHHVVAEAKEPRVHHRIQDVQEPRVRRGITEPVQPKVRRGIAEPIRPRVDARNTSKVIEPRVDAVNTSRVIEPKINQRNTARVIEPKINSVLDGLPEPKVEDYRVKQHDLNPVVAPGVPEVKISRPKEQPLKKAEAPAAFELAPIRVIPVDLKRGFADRTSEGARRG